ncbi:hypothetical protein AYJ54_05320 [Bradyrhizobium centrolobii]|uniref:Uncharacterized protein n=1 Tax=Bradyrhizobium centrolobii TaxID=1505087 RepID=A0A176Z8T0_9BRAD|nr:hypothetical protein [Bradyrhizobium centrolobii]OAF16574.1 hypothetical protein AYJ54_05320 [Bradyrhizobium centrolobii]
MWSLSDRRPLEKIADSIQIWFETEATNGFDVTPAWIPGRCALFAVQLVSSLHKSGLFRRNQADTTLPEQYEPSRSASIFASSRQAIA